MTTWDWTFLAYGVLGSIAIIYDACRKFPNMRRTAKMAILRDEFDKSGEELCWKLWIRGIYILGVGVVIVLVIILSLMLAWRW